MLLSVCIIEKSYFLACMCKLWLYYLHICALCALFSHIFTGFCWQINSDSLHLSYVCFLLAVCTTTSHQLTQYKQSGQNKLFSGFLRASIVVRCKSCRFVELCTYTGDLWLFIQLVEQWFPYTPPNNLKGTPLLKKKIVTYSRYLLFHTPTYM